jgi:hypothetical protein
MSGHGRGERLRVRVPPAALAVALGAAVGAALPAPTLDDLGRERVLQILEGPHAAQRVLLLSVSAAEVRDGTCATELGSLLHRGGARGALLLSPMDVLCRPGAHSGLIVSPLPASAQPSGAVGAPNGIAASEADASLGELGISPAPWVRRSAPGAVPSMRMTDLRSGRLDTRLVSDRVVVVGLGGDGPGDGTSREAKAAATVDGLLDGGARAATPRWVAIALGGALGAWMSIALRRFGAARMVLALALAWLVLLLSQLALASLFARSLLPLGTLLLASGTSIAALFVPRWLRSRRSVRRAHQLIDRAALFRARGLDDLKGAEFFLRVASLAKQCHPAEVVLVAELPAHKWHLRFWSGENLIRERRRDVRRTPYCDEHGVPRIRVVRKYLDLPDMPVLVVPLIALGEIEGYVFLCGEQAEAAHAAEPRKAEVMANELALLLRRRRLQASDEDAGLAPSDGARDGSMSAGLARAAGVILEDIDLFGAVLRDAPVGVLYADSFGHVRLVGREVASWLESFGAPLPSGSDPWLAPGALTLVQVIGAMTGAPPADSARWITELMAKPEGIELSVVTPEANGSRPVKLLARALRKHAAGVDVITGYVATVVAQGDTTPVAVAANVIPFAAVDPLVAFPLAETCATTIHAAARAAGRSIEMVPCRTSAFAIGHKAALFGALSAFLADAAASAPADRKPIVSVREKSLRTELALVDLHLGVPRAALDRVLAAPDLPPPGLESLGRLVHAVEESHGTVRLRAETGWGVSVIISLLRARPTLVSQPTQGATVIQLKSKPPRAS